MDSNTDDIQKITGTLITLEYASTIGIARFKTDEGELTLYGERRMMEMLADYVDRPLLLFVKTDYSWSWRTVDESIIDDEI